MVTIKPRPVAILAITLLAACQQPEKPVTETEALDFAQKIETSITQHNADVLDSILDVKYFTGLVLRKANQRFNFTLAAQAKAAVADFHMGQNVLASVSKAGAYNLVRQYAKDGHQHLLFRLVSEEGELNYHDFELIKSDKGVKAIDVYSYESGEELSKTVTESLLASAKTSGMTEAERDNDQLVSQAKQFLTGGNPEEAWSFFVQLPDSVRKKKQIQQLHISIAEKLNDSALKAALKEYQTNYPQEPSVYLLSFKTDLRSKDFPAALDALNRFDSILPSDPFLDIYRALIYKAMNDPLQSRLALERIHVWNPLNGNVIVELVDNQVKAGHPDSAAVLIREAQARKLVTPEQLDQVMKVYPTLRPYLK
jgi:hypothetical protein